ncbi:SGNH/GDSL hydrolase family protein [Klebsiella quasipneumoniae subsp. quasipneumoniae]|uniref:SGNH/GDSL hydrolase family protein n=1 Tax=Klebsiella quasipneumoniae TaxID=1463165 RepID=UPI002010A36B|nr:SGNH/GDSL hydrolase family protein [Klebsiella quasipneumoniae]MCL1441196.1 SGNH/GDSL hydrolase family protein [Klebsiella quasipneumoniae]
MATTDTQQTAQFAAEAAVSAAEAKQYLIEVQQGYQDISATTQEAKNAATAAEAAKAAAETAEQNSSVSAVASSESATAAAGSAAQAEEYKNDASEYALNKFTFYKTPSDPDGTIAGLAATTNGQSFRVAEGPEATAAFKTYENQDGVAVLQASQPGTAAITGTIREFPTLEAAQADADAGNIMVGSTAYYRSPDDSALAIEVINTSGTLQPTGRRVPSQEFVSDIGNRVISFHTHSSQLVPLNVDDAGNVPVWLTDGDLSFRGIADDAIEKIKEKLPGMDGLEQIQVPDQLVPLHVDDAGNVPVWLNNGNLAVRGLDQSIIDLFIQSSSSLFQLREAPLSATKPIATDGRTIFKFKAKLGRVINGGYNTTVRIMLTGDSWTEYVAIPQAMYNLVSSKYTATNSSYISVNGQYMLNGAAFTKTAGWDLYDASQVSVGPTNGCGPDGQSISTTAADQSINITGQQCTQINILYQDLDGIFRYRIDGGSWVVVTGGGTGVMNRITVSSLADAVHTLDIDTAGNAGTVAIHGFWCPRGVRGIEIQKCGNAGITGGGFTNFSSQIQQYASFMQPDLVFVILGTNDFRMNRSISAYVNGLKNIVEKYRAAYSDTGFVFISPARCNASGNTPSSEFRDAMAELAMELGVEFFNQHDDWDVYSVMNSYGVWVDSLHLNDAGAAALVKSLDKHFLSL